MAHISEKMLQAYVGNRLPVKEEQAVMEHIAMCDSCARRFAVHMEKGILLPPPPDLKQEILDKTVDRKDFVFLIKDLSEKNIRQRKELLAYSMRVVFAMAASIMILLTMSFQNDAGQLPKEIVQTQEKTTFLFKRGSIVRKTVSEKDSEEEEGKEDSDKEERKKFTNSLQEASGAVGDTLADFWKKLWDGDIR